MNKLYCCCLLLLLVGIWGCKKSAINPASMASGPTSVAITDSVPQKVTVTEPTPVVKDTTTKVVVVLGSSTAAGWGASTYDSCWVSRLQSAFNKDTMRVKVVNFGAPGYVTYHCMPSTFSPPNNRPWSDVGRNITKAITYHPKLIICNLPTNDISSSYTDSEILSNYAILVKIMKDEGIEFIITGTQPRNFYDIVQRQRLKNFNDLMEPLYGSHYVNYLSELSSPSFTILDKYSAGDGTHLNNRGHRVVFESLMASPVLRKTIGYTTL